MFSPDEIGPTIAECLGGFPSASNETLERGKKRFSTQVTDEFQVKHLRDETNEDASVHLHGSHTFLRRGVIRNGSQKSVLALRNSLPGMTRDEGKSAIICLENSARHSSQMTGFLTIFLLGDLAAKIQ
ncbi:hypothetical protein HNY73_010349 [Argiope bruennichi]|uniref:Uncharacterized protein n=1 Tax=Argiope bruennichi TaxID=94029 RepID=A0A8T0F0N7_ARGBR|nr:hypothetical protein HNY73_010349 [Argiope bruennichi]